MITKNSFNTTAIFDKGRSYYPTHYFVYEGKYIGSFIITEELDGECGIWSLSIKEEYRGQGYGQLMMLELMAHFGYKHLYLYVEDGNSIAHHLYHSVGFQDFFHSDATGATCMRWGREYV